MPFNPSTGQWDYSYGQDQPGSDYNPSGLAPAPAPRTAGYNNPLYDSQLIGQQNQQGQGSFQPMPQYNPAQDSQVGATNGMGMPGYQGYGGNDLSAKWDFSGQQPGATTMPVQNPDILGSGWQWGSGLIDPGVADFTKWPGYAGTDPQDPGIPVDKNGHELPNPPWWQMALEDPNGPYANRQAGDYGPTGAPNFVLNPQTQQDWVDRYNWFGQNQGALLNPTAPHPMQAQAQQGPVVPWQQFKSNVYADTNAQRSFNELSGVVDDARLQQAQDLYGWQNGPMGLATGCELRSFPGQRFRRCPP
jgi:hypothetical protein